MKTLILITTLTLSLNSFAGIHCGNQYYNEGEAHINEVLEACNVDSEYQVNNLTSYIQHVYINENGMKNDLLFIDGELKSIESKRF